MGIRHREIRQQKREKLARRWAAKEKRPDGGEPSRRCNRDRFGLIVKKDGKSSLAERAPSPGLAVPA